MRYTCPIAIGIFYYLQIIVISVTLGISYPRTSFLPVAASAINAVLYTWFNLDNKHKYINIRRCRDK